MTMEATKPTTKHIYRRGDLVRIVTPEIFVRCGYPLTPDGIMPEMGDKHGVAVRAILDGLHLGYNQREIAEHDILRRIAYHTVKARGFGGRTRAIYTETRPEHWHKTFEVMDKRVVQTGTYQPGWRDSEGECDPPYLDNQKAHIILRLYREGGMWPDFEIEAANVELVKAAPKEKPKLKTDAYDAVVSELGVKFGLMSTTL